MSAIPPPPLAAVAPRALAQVAPSTHVLHALGERFVHFAEDFLGEDIEAKLARISIHTNEVGFDPFGGDLRVGRYALSVAAFFHRLYFRTEVFGIDQLPPGRLLIVANHSGQIPIDGLMIGASLMLDAEPPRFPRSMVEKWSAELPFVSVLFPRIGQVLGSPDNARRLLNQEQTLLIFPEGVRGISKTFQQRYQMTNFGLGFMRLALETQTPIVPVAVIGAEEQYVSLGNIESLARMLRFPVFPLIPQLLLTGGLPLPTRYRLHFGAPMSFEGDPDDDDAVIDGLVSQVRTRIQSMIQRGLRERPAVFW